MSHIYSNPIYFEKIENLSYLRVHETKLQRCHFNLGITFAKELRFKLLNNALKIADWLSDEIY